MHVCPVHSHSGAGVGFGVQLYSGVPVQSAIGRAEVEDTGSVSVGIGLTSEHMDGFAAGDDVGAANFLPLLSDADWIAPGSAVVSGLAKVQRLANRAHISSGGQQINGVADGEETAVLHRVIARGRSDS